MAEEQSQRLRGLVFFNDLDLQIIEFELLHEIILCEAGFSVTLELQNVLVQPDRLAEIKLQTDVIQCAEYFVGAGVIGGIRNTGVPEHMIILKGSGP